MRYFSTGEWYEIKGRGQVAVIKQPPRDTYDPNTLVGEVVVINLKKYTVKGVETSAINRTPEAPYNLSFGLLVEPVPLPPCLPTKKRYKTIHTCHRMLMHLQKQCAYQLEMYECADHWHIIRAK